LVLGVVPRVDRGDRLRVLVIEMVDSPEKSVFQRVPGRVESRFIRSAGVM
jgi:hypothetical protein